MADLIKIIAEPKTNTKDGQWELVTDDLDHKRWERNSSCGTSWCANIDHFEDGSYLEVIGTDQLKHCKLVMYPDGTFDTECVSVCHSVTIDPCMITSSVTIDQLPLYWKEFIDTLDVNI